MSRGNFDYLILFGSFEMEGFCTGVLVVFVFCFFGWVGGIRGDLLWSAGGW